MGSEANRTLLQPHEQEKEAPEFQKESQEMGLDLKTRIGQGIQNLKQLKSLEILHSALVIFKSNNRYMVLMMLLSSIPFFIFVIFFEIRLQKVENYTVEFLEEPLSYQYFVELCCLYLVVYPLVELLSSSVIIRSAAKICAGEKEPTFEEMIGEVFSQMKGSLKVFLKASFWVHLLSTSTPVAQFWIVANHIMISTWVHVYDYDYRDPIAVCWNVFQVGIQTCLFVTFLDGYISWSTKQNMGMVILVLEEEETGNEVLEMEGYHGKRCSQTGFQLMLSFYAFLAVLRLPCMLGFGEFNANVSGVLATTMVVGLVCLENLVKWVAFVLYFYDCKAQALQKKVDEDLDVGRTGESHDAC